MFLYENVRRKCVLSVERFDTWCVCFVIQLCSNAGIPGWTNCVGKDNLQFHELQPNACLSFLCSSIHYIRNSYETRYQESAFTLSSQVVRFPFTLQPTDGGVSNGTSKLMCHWTARLRLGRLQLKCDGTRWCTGGEVKRKLGNGVGSLYPSHYLGTWCIQHYYRWCAPLGCQ